MKFGIHLPDFSPLAGREPTIRIARRVEDLGLDSLWASDHVLMPERIETRYPYNRTGTFGHDTTWNFVDPFMSLGVAAGCTERVELGVTVLILPYRDPIVTAKMLASLDMLSGGRVILGAGIGWMAEEFAALNLPYYPQRGRVSDEWIRIYRTCWEDALPRYEGNFTNSSRSTSSRSRPAGSRSGSVGRARRRSAVPAGLVMAGIPSG